MKFAKPVSTTGQNLVGLWRPSFTRVDQKLYLFGGGGHVTNDLHVLDLTTMHWEGVLVSLFFLFFLTFTLLSPEVGDIGRQPFNKDDKASSLLSS